MLKFFTFAFKNEAKETFSYDLRISPLTSGYFFLNVPKCFLFENEW